MAVTHSIGHLYDLGDRTVGLKLLGEPMRLPPGGEPEWLTLVARFSAGPGVGQPAPDLAVVP